MPTKSAKAKAKLNKGGYEPLHLKSIGDIRTEAKKYGLQFLMIAVMENMEKKDVGDNFHRSWNNLFTNEYAEGSRQQNAYMTNSAFEPLVLFLENKDCIMKMKMKEIKIQKAQELQKFSVVSDPEDGKEITTKATTPKTTSKTSTSSNITATVTPSSDHDDSDVSHEDNLKLQLHSVKLFTERYPETKKILKDWIKGQETQEEEEEKTDKEKEDITGYEDTKEKA